MREKKITRIELENIFLTNNMCLLIGMTKIPFRITSTNSSKRNIGREIAFVY